MITLTENNISEQDIDSLCDFLKSQPRLTQGKLCKQFEEEFAEYIGCKYATFVNSGSSANLLAMDILKRKHQGGYIAVPAVSWSTDYAPVVQCGFTPVLVDCNLRDFTSSIQDLEQVFKEYKPVAYLHVSVLGFPGDMIAILELCEKYNVTLVEDNCESLGSEYCGVKLGNFGVVSTYSFYYSHHISTVEGGMICTNDLYTDSILKCVREHGWVKNSPEWYKGAKHDKGNDFIFHHIGYNLRNTEIAAFLGIKQLKRFVERDEVNIRHANIRKSSMHFPLKHELVSAFGIPYLLKDEFALKAAKVFLNKEVEYRPIIAGSMNHQPMVKEKRECPNADVVSSLGIYLPNRVGIDVSSYKEYIPERDLYSE